MVFLHNLQWWLKGLKNLKPSIRFRLADFTYLQERIHLFLISLRIVLALDMYGACCMSAGETLTYEILY
jgi:hypothetical protein